jgi:hypothetical protein
MSARGGEDRSWYRPLTPTGNAERDSTVVGNHIGAFAALNVHNAQSGWVYMYERRDANALISSRNLGWRRVTENDPETMGDTSAVEMDMGTSLDSGKTVAFSDIVLLKRPLEVHRKERKAEEDENKARLEGATEAYIHGPHAMGLESEFGGQADGPMRYSRGKHRLEPGSTNPRLRG